MNEVRTSHARAETPEAPRGVDADEIESVVDDAAGCEPGDERAGADERRKHEGQHEGDPPEPLERKVGPCGEPRQPRSDGDR